jgi:UDP-N-acetyl-D-mannosaminuronic acid dehydrogenase
VTDQSPKASPPSTGDRRSGHGSGGEPTICIVGGAGHVGLPLALVLASKGHSVRIYDINREVLARIADGVMPFAEADAEPLLRQALDANRLLFSSSVDSISGVPTVIVTIGTPVDEFMNPETRVIKHWADESLPYLSPGQLLVFRSTIYPGTTQWLESYLTRQGKEVLLAYCPERIVQGFAVRELQTLPQIVSGTTTAAADAAAAIFSSIAPQIVRLAPMEAEFAKLFTNAHRYIEFAIANQFYMIANSAGVDYNRVLEGLKTNYPRAKGMPTAGLSAGPCLVKDTMQLAAFSQNQFPLGHAAMLVNEGLVLYLVEEMKRKYPISEMVVGLLGMAFKADCDDTRSSLSYKLKKILKLVAADVLTTDPYVATDPELLPTNEVIERSDLLVLCTPHTAYRDLDRRNKPMIDVWGFWRTPNAEGRPVDAVV